MPTKHPIAPRLATDRLHALRGRLYGSAYALLSGPPGSPLFHAVIARLLGASDVSGGPCARLLAVIQRGGAPELRREYAALFGITPPSQRFECRRGQRATCTRAYWEATGHVEVAGPVEDLAALAHLAVETAYAMSAGDPREAERLVRLQTDFLQSGAGHCIRRVSGYLQREGGFVYRQLGTCITEQLLEDRHLFAAGIHHRSGPRRVHPQI